MCPSTVEVTQKASIVPRRRRAAIETPYLVASYETQGNGGRILPLAHKGIAMLQNAYQSFHLFLVHGTQIGLHFKLIGKWGMQSDFV